MDATQIILLTSLFNIIISGLVGGIVIYTLQKKIDATIQKSLFEHQTKFAIIHPKTLEVLETLYQKFVQCAKSFSPVLIDVFETHRNNSQINFHKHKDLELQLHDTGKYFLNNRLFLPASINAEIDGMFDSFSNFEWLIRSLSENGNTPSSDDIDVAKYLMTTLGLDENLFEPELGIEDLLFNSINQYAGRIATYTQRLEMLYKSVAETQQ